MTEPEQSANSMVIDMMKAGNAPHYAIILDRSPTSKTLIDGLRTEQAGELRARVTSAAFDLWEKSHFEMVIVWGTWGYSGGLTVNAASLDVLLNEALPAVMARTIAKGGLCAFIPGVDESVRQRVMDKIAELQPTGPTAH